MGFDISNYGYRLVITRVLRDHPSLVVVEDTCDHCFSYNQIALVESNEFHNCSESLALMTIDQEVVKLGEEIEKMLTATETRVKVEEVIKEPITEF